MIRILIADDHAVVRAGVRQILAGCPDITVAGEASTGQEAMTKVLEKDYDLLLLDITMPDRSGFDILKDLKSRKPRLPVLFLSMHPEEQYAIRVLRMGGDGYLSKRSLPEELVAAIRKVSSGRKYISVSLAEKLATELGTDVERPLHERLSDREYQVLCMLGSGKAVKNIAQELMLTAQTVSTYRSRLLRKMGMKTTAELIRYAVENRLA